MTAGDAQKIVHPLQIGSFSLELTIIRSFEQKREPGIWCAVSANYSEIEIGFTEQVENNNCFTSSTMWLYHYCFH